MSKARLFSANIIFEEMNHTNVQKLKDFIDNWNEIVSSSDLNKSQYTRDRTLLSKLTHFVLKNCKFHVHTQTSNNQTEDDADDRKDFVSTTATVTTTAETTKKQDTLDENEFGNLVDRLLISLSSDASQYGTIHVKRAVTEWTTPDVCNVIRGKYPPNHIHARTLENIVEQRGINGKLLFKYHESQEHMMYLLFSKIDHIENFQSLI